MADKENPFFSVIVLAYQVEPFIEECLNSILLQTYQDIEIVIVNPVCTDRTESICRKYMMQDKRIRLIQMENKGQLLNRHKGFMAATGKYLLCIDGDDWWKINTLEEIYTAIKKMPSDLIIFGYEMVSNGKVLKEQRHVFPDGAVYKEKEKRIVYEKLIQGKGINSICTKVLKKELLFRITEDFSRYSSVRYGEDLLFSLYAADAADKILYLDKALYCYRKREDSTVRVFSPRELEDKRIIVDHIDKMMKKWEMDESRYYEMLYRSVFDFYVKVVFRCSTSVLTTAAKKMFFTEVRKDSLYTKSQEYKKWNQSLGKESIFMWLFFKGDIFVLQCGKTYRAVRKIKNKLKYIKERLINDIQSKNSAQ